MKMLLLLPVLFLLISLSGSFEGTSEKQKKGVLVFEDHFDSLNTTYWTVGTLRDEASGDRILGAKGDHLLGDQYDGYITAEDVYVEEGNLVLRNQKRDYQGSDISQSPMGKAFLS